MALYNVYSYYTSTSTTYPYTLLLRAECTGLRTVILFMVGNARLAEAR